MTTTEPPATSTASISSLSPVQGAVGSTVTISGLGFGTLGDGNVQFGPANAIEATGTTSTDTQMVVTVPATESMIATDNPATRPIWYQHDRTVMVTVTPNGGTASIGVSFRLDSNNGHGHGYGRGHGHGHGHDGVRNGGDDN